MFEKLSIRCDSGELRRASTWLENICLERGVPVDEINRLDLCLNEVLANVILHGGRTVLSSTICLYIDVFHELSFSEATLVVSDAGAPFDPFVTSPKLEPKKLFETQIGGLGLLMIRSFSDNQSYRYIDGRNQITLSVRWSNTR